MFFLPDWFGDWTQQESTGHTSVIPRASPDTTVGAPLTLHTGKAGLLFSSEASVLSAWGTLLLESI